MKQIELSAGIIEYDDTGGDAPTVVLVHGVLMNGSLWRHVVADLRSNFRCVVPTLPLGGHRLPMRPDADLSMRGIARLLAEFVDHLDLRDVSLVVSDWGGPQLLIGEPVEKRIGRMVITSCEAFDNVPPGVPGRTLVSAARMPGGLYLALQQLRIRPLRRLPMTWGWMTKRPVPREVMDEWLKPALTDAAIRRDLHKYLRNPAQDRRDLIEASRRMPHFSRSVLIVWASEDRVMPLTHGRRLASLFPQARIVEISDSYTLIPEDQPQQVANCIQDFIQENTIRRG